MTIPRQRVLRALLADVAELYGAQIAEAAGLASGTVHPILARTASGVSLAREALARAYRPRPGRLVPSPLTDQP